MQKIYFSIFINAPVEKVWNTMLEDATYRQWTIAFAPGSQYVGSWEQGSEIKFLSEDFKQGMYSRIRENRLHEYISIEHIGIVMDGVVDTTSDMVKKWAPSTENYTFKKVDGGTELSVDMDIDDEYKESFEVSWPKALQALKELCEK